MAEATETVVEQDVQATDDVAPESSGAEVGIATEGDPAQTEEAVDYVLLGEEPATRQQSQSDEQDWLKKLRRDSRELARLKKEREQAETAARASAIPTLGPKPTAEQFAYDTEKLTEALDKWHEDKAKVERAQEQQRELASKEAQAWNQTLATYAQQKAVVSKYVPDFEDREAAVNDRLTHAQQGILLHVAGKRAEIVAALGASPKALDKLAALSDPLMFAAEIARLELSMATAPQRKPPPPESTIRGGGGKSGVAITGRLEDLRAKAQKTGDFTEYLKAKSDAKAKA
jgi:hypothetical protein